jgi:hypothetical protein
MYNITSPVVMLHFTDQPTGCRVMPDRWRNRKETASTTVLKSDPYFDPEDGDGVEFRLTYQGLLLATQKDPLWAQPDRRADHKRDIRRVFHLQLKRLWEINPYLKHGYPVKFDWSSPRSGVTHGCTIADYLAPLYKRNAYSCIPLVREELSLICSIEILFLRPDIHGSILKSGDIDNRIKTLFDALRLPKGSQELCGYNAPQDDEKPFYYCLLEDDSLITHVSVETDILLQPTGEQFDVNDARLVITVRLRPYNTNPANQSF